LVSRDQVDGRMETYGSGGDPCNKHAGRSDTRVWRRTSGPHLREETLAISTPSSGARAALRGRLRLPDTPALPKKHQDDVAGGAREKRQGRQGDRVGR